MATYIQRYWAAQDLQAVSLLQNLASPGALLLNGTYFNATSSTINFNTQGFARNVSLTSVNNLSAASFTISGVQNNTVVTNTIAGPNNNTVYTTDAFDIVSSITVNSAVNGVKAGTGLVGFFPILNRIAPNSFSISTPSTLYALGFTTESSNGCTYEVYQSLSDLSGIGETYLALVADSSFISVAGPYVNITQILQQNDICTNILLKVTPALGTSTLTMEFLQF
jgi:hypothetical protein